MATNYYYTADLQLSINGVWISSGTPTINATKGMHGKYVIKVFKNKDGVITQLTTSAGSGGVSVHAIRNVDSVSWVNSPQVQTINYVDGNLNLTKYEAEFVGDTVPATFRARFEVEREADHDIEMGDGRSPVDWAATSSQTAAGITGIQSVNYTASTTASIPPMPKTNDWLIATNNVKNTSQAKWDASINQWVVVQTTSVNGNADARTVTLKYFDSKGVLKKTTPLGTDKKPKGPAYKAGQKVLLTAMQNTYTTIKPTTSNPGTPPDNKVGTFNPPNHFYTRRPSFADLVKATGDPNLAGQVGNHYALGKMIQDSNSAKLLNTKLGSAKTIPNWGFQFTYNPSSISYATSANTPIDWTLGTSDTANVLGGPTSISFDLYLNRIADLAELNGAYNPNNYPKPLSDVDKLGLKTRGTEYDLEFLYRIVNGTPIETNLTLTKQLTSDFGYITGVPFWLFLHDNMRYYVGLSSMNVNHVIFSKDMIPIFSVVSLTFVRYPVFDKTGYVGKKQADAYQAGQNPKTTDTTTGGTTP